MLLCGVSLHRRRGIRTFLVDINRGGQHSNELKVLGSPHLTFNDRIRLAELYITLKCNEKFIGFNHLKKHIITITRQDGQRKDSRCGAEEFGQRDG
jgi:hypothetical protein